MGVKIRKIRNKLYLVICKNGKRKTESIGITVPEDSSCKDKELRKKAYELADYCRAKRELQIAAKEWNVTDPKAGKSMLIDYMREIGKARTQTHRINLCVKKLENYRDGNIQIQAVSEQWLLNRLSRLYQLRLVKSKTSLFSYVRSL